MIAQHFGQNTSGAEGQNKPMGRVSGHANQQFGNAAFGHFLDQNLISPYVRRDFGNRFGVYTESHFGENDRYAGANHSFGIDYATGSDWIFSGVFTTASDDMLDIPLERDAVSLGASVDREDYRFSARTEYRTDKGSGYEIDQQLLAASYSRILSESSRVLSRLNLLRTDDAALGGGEHARFTEFDIGHAWRPAAREKWTALTRYSYLYDAAGVYQFGGGPDQKVHIVSAEALYQLNPRWEIGGKVAWKNGEARATLGIGEWHDYEVSLVVARARYHLAREWDLLAEYRTLEDRSAGNPRAGVLLGAYRSLNDNFQIGGGYNFTDFSDYLRDADYDNRGFFLDVVGVLYTGNNPAPGQTATAFQLSAARKSGRLSTLASVKGSSRNSRG